MKKIIPAWFRSLIVFFILLIAGGDAFASHIVGMDLNYIWDSGNVYTIRLVAYGNCSSIDSSGGTAYLSLPSSTPEICILNGTTSIGTIYLSLISLDSAKDITPVCTADSLNDQCHDLTSIYPGIREYIYEGTYTLPSESSVWRFIFNGVMVASSAGRAGGITNIMPGTIIELIDTLNNTINNHHNSSPDLTVVPVPFFCNVSPDSYNPGAVDPDVDSFSFSLVKGKTAPFSGCGAGGYVSYIAPYTATAPMATSSFGFNESTGQITFTPTTLQRALVVYNIEEYRHGQYGDTLVGTSQREMTFTIIDCSNTSPSANIDSMTGDGNISATDSDYFYICANSGDFSFSLDPTESDTSNVIYVSQTGLPAGATFTVIDDSTNHPHVVVSWTSTSVAFGNYTFYITYTDNNCPLTGQQTIAYTIGIYPLPGISASISSPATCKDSAIAILTPTGLGQPWTVILEPADTINRDDTVAFTYHFAPGTFVVNIYSSLSTQCNGTYTLTIAPPPPILPLDSLTMPNVCGNNTGAITLLNLNAGANDGVIYQLNGVWQPVDSIIVGSDSVITLSNLCAGVYDSVIIGYGNCISVPLGPFDLNNPPFLPLRLDTLNPTACGYKNGIIKIIGLAPGQTDTVNYTMQTGTVVATQTPVISFVGTDSTIKLLGLGAGIYNNIVVSTPGNCNATGAYACSSIALGPMTLTAPPDTSRYNYEIHYGCSNDTLVFKNTSTAPGSPSVYYQWTFSDGSFIDTATSPVHIYPAKDTTYPVILTMNNTECYDTAIQDIKISNFATVGFTSNPPLYSCQYDAVVFTNTTVLDTTGSYTWYFGDGVTSIDINPTHTFTNTGTYQVMLVLSNFVPCNDTATETLAIDSNSMVSVNLSDSTICEGQAVTMTGIYALQGETGIIWSFGDGNTQENINPVVHAYETSGLLPVQLNINYRACPDDSVIRNILVVRTPVINLGPDTAICPGGTSITLRDSINEDASGATWLWSTGATTAQLVITAPGYYYSTVSIGGCSASDSVWVANDCYIDIPNVFTPNNDGTNDYFFPRQFLTKGLTTFSMNIYNRWGQEVFSSTSLDGRGWDGKFNSTPQPSGVYIYVIDATFIDGQREHRQGNITLLR